MSDNTGIEWTDATWNPVTGCTKVSEGCRHCYALTFAERWRGTEGHYFENGFDLTLRPDKINLPYSWKKPKKIFVNSMSDLFHKDVPDDFIRKVWEVMVACSHHTFQVLTKRPERMREWVSLHGIEISGGKPAENIWLGTSVEDQKAAEERIIPLLQTPAAKRFLSCEPLLGQLDLEYPESIFDPKSLYCCSGYMCGCMGMATEPPLIYGIDWVIVGGESGHGARPMNENWVLEIQGQCERWNVAFFFKQWGGVNKAKAGRELNGKTYDAMPV